jgi:hypothetical protein
LLLAWNPQVPDVAARRNLDVARLRDLLAAAAARIGVAQMAQDSPGELCSLFGSVSNSTVRFSADVDGMTCDKPPAGAAVAELTFTLGSRAVILVCWYDDGP